MFGLFLRRVFGRHPKWHGLADQFGKYLVGGSLYFWVGYGVFALCYSGLHWAWLPSKIVCDVIGWSLNYFVQRFWAFKNQVHLSEMQHAGRYIAIESVGFAIDYALIGGLVHVGITPYIGFFISGIFFTFWSFLWYKYWVFPETGGKKSAKDMPVVKL
jgi:putative flippase GtrA